MTVNHRYIGRVRVRVRIRTVSRVRDWIWVRTRARVLEVFLYIILVELISRGFGITSLLKVNACLPYIRL